MTQGIKIFRLVGLLGFVLLGGTLGYHQLFQWDWLDALYMTTITITTVGFGEVRHMNGSERIFTIVLLLASMGVVAYTVTALASLVVESRLGSLLERRRMDKRIESLKDHFIICGHGRTGRAVRTHLERAQEPVVVVENMPDRIEVLKTSRCLFVEGDATHDECLKRAGIDRARGLVAALGNDAENVYLVFSARQMSPKLTISSWASSEEAERKVLKAGANYTLSPYSQGGLRIVNQLLAPHALEFMDHALAGRTEIRLGEIGVTKSSYLCGNSLQGAGIRRDLGVIIIGIRRSDETFQFNPSAEEVLNENDILIGIGSQEQLEKLKSLM